MDLTGQLAFAGYLRDVAQVGGTTIKDYVQRLPTALALYHSNFKSGYRQFTLEPEVKQALHNMAVEIPPRTPTVRDPVTLETVLRISQDQNISADTRSAIVAAFYLGFRPINLVSVKRSRAVRGHRDRPLQWRDLRQVTSTRGKIGFEVTVRKEKTASAHSGDFAPKLLLPAEQGMPCPVEAIQVMARKHGMLPSQPVFPDTTDKDLQKALDKHAEAGQRLTPYSLRIGSATQLAAAGLPMEYQRRAGNWATDKTADRYVRNSAASWYRAQKALKHNLVTPKPSPAMDSRKQKPQEPDHKGSEQARPMQVRTYPDGLTDILLVQKKKGKWRGYFYEPATGERAQRRRARQQRMLSEYEPFTVTELRYMVNKTTVKEAPVFGQLEHDIAYIRRSILPGQKFPDRPNSHAGQRDNKPAAAGGGGN
ncbi:MAG: hypothetical protein GY737_10055 [Desulfobacteraceae bacterium]|nr:hypothetical protein [Desulfobacteraceae bacterium]